MVAGAAEGEGAESSFQAAPSAADIAGAVDVADAAADAAADAPSSGQGEEVRADVFGERRYAQPPLALLPLYPRLTCPSPVLAPRTTSLVSVAALVLWLGVPAALVGPFC